MKFGLLPFGVLPENLVHRYYGYRGIDHGASIDVPPDRTTYEGQPNDLELPTDEFKSLPFVWWFDTVALPKLNEMVSGLPNDEITTIAETPRYKAYARRVGGYVHVGAWEVRDEHQYDEYEKPTEGKWSGKAELPDLGTKIKINFTFRCNNTYYSCSLGTDCGAIACIFYITSWKDFFTTLYS